MMHNMGSLYDELHKALLEINKQIEVAKADAEKTIELLPYPDSVTVYSLKNRDGKFILVDLLAARAQVLSGMAALKAADVASKQKPGPRR